MKWITFFLLCLVEERVPPILYTLHCNPWVWVYASTKRLSLNSKKVVSNLLSASVALIWKPVNWFAQQIHSVHSPLSAGGGVGGGWTKFSKRGGLTGPQLLKGVAGNKGVSENKLKSEIFDDKKSL